MNYCGSEPWFQYLSKVRACYKRVTSIADFTVIVSILTTCVCVCNLYNEYSFCLSSHLQYTLYGIISGKSVRQDMYVCMHKSCRISTVLGIQTNFDLSYICMCVI